jgi:hypothetical protein
LAAGKNAGKKFPARDYLFPQASCLQSVSMGLLEENLGGALMRTNIFPPMRF